MCDVERRRGEGRGNYSWMVRHSNVFPVSIDELSMFICMENQDDITVAKICEIMNSGVSKMMHLFPA